MGNTLVSNLAGRYEAVSWCSGREYRAWESWDRYWRKTAINWLRTAMRYTASLGFYNDFMHYCIATNWNFYWRWSVGIGKSRKIEISAADVDVVFRVERKGWRTGATAAAAAPDHAASIGCCCCIFNILVVDAAGECEIHGRRSGGAAVAGANADPRHADSRSGSAAAGSAAATRKRRRNNCHLSKIVKFR